MKNVITKYGHVRCIRAMYDAHEGDWQVTWPAANEDAPQG